MSIICIASHTRRLFAVVTMFDKQASATANRDKLVILTVYTRDIPRYGRYTLTQPQSRTHTRTHTDVSRVSGSFHSNVVYSIASVERLLSITEPLPET